MTDPAIADSLVLESVIATVDAAAGAATLDAHPESVKQAAIADRIVVTKTDLSDPAANGLFERLRALNPAAPKLTAVRGAVDASRLFGGGMSRSAAAPTYGAGSPPKPCSTSRRITATTTPPAATMAPSPRSACAAVRRCAQ